MNGYSHVVPAGHPRDRHPLPPRDSVNPGELYSATDSQVKKLVRKMKTDKSSSIRHIRTQVLKDCFTSLPQVAVAIINSTISLKKVPDVWKTGTVVPLPKAGQSTDVSNWRPICILNACNKLTEKVVHQQLLNHLIRENIISRYQSGFMPGRCTGDAIYGLLMEI